jgi:xylulokinase
MSVMLNAASCLDFVAGLTGYSDVPTLLADAELADTRPDGPCFLPYLTGERTPHNDVHARGVFAGLRVDTTRTDLAHAVLEGVGLGLLDGMEAVDRTGLASEDIDVIGGGSRSIYWIQMLADIFGRPLTLRAGGEVGPSLGAARLAQLAVEPGSTLDQICSRPPVIAMAEPRQARHLYYRQTRQPLFRELYRQLKPIYSATIHGS